jgi:hypothetical protein
VGEYLTIIWDAETPAAAEVPWDNCLLVVQGSEASLAETTVYATTSDDWSTVLSAAGFGATSQAYESAAQFFSATPTPGATLYVLAMVSGSVDIYENVPLAKVTDYIYETPIKPPLGWYGAERVRYYPDAALTGFWYNNADGSVGMGFTIVTDGAGNWNGQLNFLNGLSGNTIDVPPAEGSKVTASFRVGSSTASLSETIETFNINMMAAAYENSRTMQNYTGSNTYFGTQSDDLMRFTNTIAGKNCILFYALPGAVAPQESGVGYSVYWDQLKNFIGAREDVALIKAKPSSSNHDMAAGYLGMTAGTHPHTTMTFAVPHMGIQEEESLLKRSYWNDGQIATPMTRRELTGNPYLISHGFTLGTGYSSRINYVRCKYIISANLVNGLWALLASRTVRMSYAGMQLVKTKITAIFKTLQDQGIHDGLAYVRIPIEIDLKNNTQAGSDARAARTIPSIEIGFYWYSSLEKIIITGIRNEA